MVELQSQAKEKDRNVPIKLWRRQKQINKGIKVWRWWEKCLEMFEFYKRFGINFVNNLSTIFSNVIWVFHYPVD